MLKSKTYLNAFALSLLIRIYNLNDERREIKMTKWAGWIAALGGLLAGLPSVGVNLGNWGVPLGAVLAIVFGVWEVYQ